MKMIHAALRLALPINLAMSGLWAQVVPQGTGRPELNTIMRFQYHGGNLISNGSFEGEVSGWEVTGASLLQPPTGSFPWSGRQAMIVSLAGDFAGKTITSRAFPLKSGKSYTLTFRYKASGLGEGRNVRPIMNIRDHFDAPEVSISTAPFLENRSEWSFYQATFQIGLGGTGTLSMAGIVGSTQTEIGLFFDDVVLVETGALAQEKVERGITFLDGMNRPIQTMKQDGEIDRYTESQYDEQGRMILNTLPIGLAGGHAFLPDMTRAASGTPKLDLFYGSSAGAGMNAQGFAYSETQYDSSPLGRVKKVLMPGGVWRPEHAVQKYYASTEGPLPGDWPSDLPLTETNTKKFVEMTVGEQDRQATREYKDLFGRVLLRENQYETWISSAYQYDGLGNLTKIVAPPGPHHTEIETDYTYNSLGQKMTESSPDFGLSRYLYNRKGQLRFSQTVNQAAKGAFSYIIYDALGRPRESGDYAAAIEMTQANADFASFPGLDGNKTVRTLNFYDEKPRHRHYCQENSQDATFFVRKDASGAQPDEFLDLNTAYAAVQSLLDNGTMAPQAVIIYVIFESTDDEIIPEPNSEFTVMRTPLDVEVPVLLEGIVRGTSRFNEIIGGDFPFQANWGPLQGRLVQSVACNAELENTPVGLRDVSKVFNYDKFGNITEIYEYNGYVNDSQKAWQKATLKYDVLSHLVEKNYFATAASAQPEISHRFNYDQLDRLAEVHDENGVLLAHNTYNALGQLASTELGEAQGKVHLAYTYHFRGWLKSIKATDHSGAILYEQTLKYEDGGAARFDGLISEYLQTGGVGLSSNFTFEYDDVSRLHRAVSSLNQGSGIQTKTWEYDYHDNGAIDGKIIDGQDFDYQYHVVDPAAAVLQGTNRLEKLSYTGPLDRDLSQIGNFAYDAGGRMVLDKSKSLQLSYDDFTGLPCRFQYAQDGVNDVYMVYDGSGNRVSKVRYLNGFIESARHYTGFGKELRLLGQVQSEIYPFEGFGRIVKGSDAEYEYEVYIRNHLGSTVKVFNTDQNVEVYRTEYEPYGKLRMEHRESTNGESVTPKFTGKEYDEESGLDYFGARFYDSDLGVWISPDAARQYYSPYTYCGNNPISCVDKNGNYGAAAGFVNGKLVSTNPKNPDAVGFYLDVGGEKGLPFMGPGVHAGINGMYFAATGEYKLFWYVGPSQGFGKSVSAGIVGAYWGGEGRGDAASWAEWFIGGSGGAGPIAFSVFSSADWKWNIVPGWTGFSLGAGLGAEWAITETYYVPTTLRDLVYPETSHDMDHLRLQIKSAINGN